MDDVTRTHETAEQTWELAQLRTQVLGMIAALAREFVDTDTATDFTAETLTALDSIETELMWLRDAEERQQTDADRRYSAALDALRVMVGDAGRTVLFELDELVGQRLAEAQNLGVICGPVVFDS